MSTWTGGHDETRTLNMANVIRVHTHYEGRCHWRKLVLVALAVVDEFFAGRFHRICDARSILENRWGNYI